MLTEKNFAEVLKSMNFIEHGTSYEKIFDDGVVMKADLDAKKLSYPAQLKGRERNTLIEAAHKENLVVFECVNRLLDKGYKPADIELEKNWQLGHTQKSGRADICVSSGDKVLFIIECKTAGAEYNHELDNMRTDGGQLFSYWQQEQSCQWLMLYASDFVDGKLKFSASSVSCNEKLYRDAPPSPNVSKCGASIARKNSSAMSSSTTKPALIKSASSHCANATWKTSAESARSSTSLKKFCGTIKFQTRRTLSTC